MSLFHAIGIGITSDEFSKKIVGSDEVSLSRSVISTGIGVAGGAAVSGTLVVASVAAAPIIVPVAIVSGTFALIKSFF